MPNFEQNPSNKKWSVRFRTIIDGELKQKRLSGYKTKKEAQAAYIDFVKEQEQKEKLREAEATPLEMLFSEMVEKFLVYSKSRVKESTYVTNLDRVNINILPFFGDMKMKEITPLKVLEWQQGLEHFSYKYQMSIRQKLVSIFKFAERYYDIKNVMQRVEPPRNTQHKKEIQYWTLEEFKAFIAVCEEERFKLVYEFLYITGCRKGETLALKWEDIDFEKKLVKIDKTLTRRTIDGKHKLSSTKNETSDRSVTLPANYCERLSKYRDANKDCLYIFGAGDKPMHENMLMRYFKAYAKKAGVKEIRIHDLRHSCASLLISQGISIVAVSSRLGHKNITQTLNTYSHLMPNEAKRIVDIFESL